ncbi:MAG TPA: TetR/AcrR family transcriptional regulator [Fontimonas sp.]
MKAEKKAGRKKAAEPQKRAYLSRKERRTALLDVAAAVVESQGWQALSMISVAEAAQVSRQLIYQHFASVDELMADTMSHLFRGRYESIRSGIAENPTDLVALLRLVEEQTFGDSPERVRALWQMLTATYSDNVEARRMGQRLRHLLTKMWAPFMQQRLGLDEKRAQALSWMLNMAFWGAHQLVEEGELSRGAALELFNGLLLSLDDTKVPPATRKTARTKATGK